MMSSGHRLLLVWELEAGTNVELNGVRDLDGSYNVLIEFLTRTDSLNKTVKNEGQTPRWSPQAAYILVHKLVLGTFIISYYLPRFHRIAALNVRDDSEIDWKLLPDENWNLWSTHALQRRWQTLKRSVKGYEEMSHQGKF